MKRNGYRTVPALLALLLLAACGTGRDAADGQQGPRTTVEVRNREGLSMEVYVIDQGHRVRLGRVGAGGTKTFTLPAYLADAGTPLRFEMESTGPNPVTRSEVFRVAPGEHLVLVIPSAR
jgi:hypothetical protein